MVGLVGRPSGRRRHPFARRLVAAAVGLTLVAATALSVSSAANADPGKKGKAPGVSVGVSDGAPNPGLVVDTMVANTPGSRNQPGIRVGNTTYAAPFLDGKNSYNQDGPSQWQVLVLDQRTSRLVWNRTYGYSARSSDTPGQDSVAASLADDLAALRAKPEAFTVVVSGHAAKGFLGFYPHGDSQQGAIDAATALKPIGFTLDGQAQQNTVGVVGAFSLVASVNTTTAASQYRWSGQKGGGRMTGLLVLNQYRDYAYLPTDRVAMDSRSAAACDAKKINCFVRVTVGDNTQSGTLVGGAGYFVTVWDKLTLALVSATTYATNGPNPTPQARLMAAALRGLPASNPGDLVVITSLTTPGDPIRTALVDASVPYADMLALSQAVASVGGTRDGFNRAAAAAAGDYTLVGWTDASTATTLEGAGLESTAAGARVQAVLTRNPQSLLRPAPLAPGQTATDELSALALATPTGTWPKLDADSLAYLIQAVHPNNPQDLPADPRRAYWSLDWDSATWAQMARAVSRVAPPAGWNPAKVTQFTSTRNRLHDEMIQVSAVRSRLDSLKKPVQALIGPDNRDRVNKVANNLAVDLLNNPEPVPFNWQVLVNVLLAFAAILAPELLVEAGVAAATANLIGKVFQAVSTDVTFGAWIGQQVDRNGGKLPSYASVSLKANEMAAKLDETMTTSMATLDRMGDLVVSDPTKLQTMGSTWCSQPNDPQPAGVCGADSQDVQAWVKASTQRANERLIYTKLAPVAWARYDTGPTYRPQTNGPPSQPSTWLSYYECQYSEADLAGAPLAATALLRQGDYLPNWADRTRDPWALWPTVQPYVLGVQRTSTPYHTPPVYPEASVLSRVFGAVTLTADATTGGLGISPRQIIPSLPDNSTSDCGWSGQGSITYWPSYTPGAFIY